MKRKLTAATAIAAIFMTCQILQADSHSQRQQHGPANTPESGQIDDRTGSLYWNWDRGLVFENYDETVSMRIGGRLHNDWTTFSPDSAIEQQFPGTRDGIAMRRAWLEFRGDFDDFMGVRIQLDFAPDDTSIRNFYIFFTDVLPARLAVGQFKEPFSMDELTSSNSTTFMERALPNAFAPSFNPGIMLSDSVADQRVTWAAGIFRDTDGTGRNIADNGYNATGRITYAPIYENEGANVLHLGAAYTYKDPEDGQFRVRQRPEAGRADRFIDTAAVDADSVGILGLEAAMVNGPFSLQGEYMRASLDGRAGQQDVDYDGWYVQGSYWLTGEHRNYSRSSGAFGYVNPERNFGQNGGWGAWELAARYSELDLNDGNIEGGKLENITAGINWHLNPNTRVMWNYVNADRKGIGKTDIYMMRLQLHF